jgi:ABC-type Na+ efflux pump permease subunit
MTFVGKILVIVIMVFSLLFLAFSTVVFTTEKNWKAETEAIKKRLSDANSENQKTKDELNKVGNDLAAEQAARAQAAQKFEGEIKSLTDEIQRRTVEITNQRTAVETAQEGLRAAQDEAKARLDETTQAREQLRLAQLQSNEFKAQQLELKNQIRLLQRELDVAKNNNKDLRDRLVTAINIIRENGFSTDLASYKTLTIEPPPDLDGEVTKADEQNRRFQISVGSDDGLVVGHELLVFRFKPNPEYLGKVRVQTVDHDHSVVTLIGTTPQGKKIQEGDIVSTKIRPRG